MKMKKAIAFLTGLSLAIPSAAISAFAEENSTQETVQPESEINTNVSVPHLYEAPVTMQQSLLPADTSEEELPASFDLRKHGLVSAVRDQGDLGTCWAHATLGCLENDKIADNPAIDLSERYLATFMVSDDYGDGSKDLQRGSNASAALSLLSNWIGAVSESVAPYEEEYVNTLSREDVQQQAEFHITDSRWYGFRGNTIHDPDNPENNRLIQCIKREICNGNALYFSLNFDENGAVNPETHALNNDNGEDFNGGFDHAVLLVGYDDNYSADNFLSKPPCDGAWLIKNSWGLDHGDNGFYWVSYYDFTIDDACAFDTVHAEEQDHLYAYDDYGANGWFAASEEGDESIFMSNIYTAKENGFVTDVMLFNPISGDQYEITVYTNLADEAVPTSGKAHSATVGSTPFIGYRTVTLDTPVHISEGERFAVVAKMSGEQGYHVMCEFSSNAHGEGVGFSQFTDCDAVQGLENEDRIMETFGANQSFFSTDGQNWTDLYDSYSYDSEFLTGNICLRAITADEGKVRFSSYSDTLAPNTDLTLSCADGTNIYYSVNGGAYKRYTAPIRFTKEMTISAYAEDSPQNVYTRHYAERKAGFSSLMFKDSNSSYYLNPTEKEHTIVLDYDSDTCILLPIMNGTVTDGETVTGSYEEIKLVCGLEPRTVTLTAQEDGLQPTEYQIHLSRAYTRFTEGIWCSRNDNSIWYYFSDDAQSGYLTNRITGEKTPFTYTIEENLLTLKTEDSVRTAKIASDPFDAIVQWEDGKEEFIFHHSFAEIAPYFTNPELCALAAEYAAATTDETPAAVSAEILGDGFVNVTVKTESNTTIIYHVDECSAIGTDQDNNVVNLTEIPEDTGISEWKEGIWQSYDQMGNPLFFFFGADGTMCAYSTYDATYVKGSYTQNNGQFCRNLYDNTERAIVRFVKDTAILTWSYGCTETMFYFSDQTPETFTFIGEEELSALASAYYEAKKCIYDPFSIVGTDENGKALLYAETDEPVYFCVDRFTGIGTDQDENPVDLYHPTQAEGTSLAAGIWKVGDPENVYGFYWFGEDGKTARFIDSTDGSVTDFTYRIVDGKGIAFKGGEKLAFTIIEEDGETMISWITPGFAEYGQGILTFVREEANKNFKFYSRLKLEEMAIKDCADKLGTKIEIAALGYDSEGNVRIHLVNPENGDEAGVYVIDHLSGIGTNQDGEEINLPQTGNNSMTNLLVALGAFLLTGFGCFALKQSGMLGRKKEEQ